MAQPSSIAHYKITAKLGEGGMGAVYRATDTKLNRDVAIKILPDALANDPEYLARFTREAQVLAALNHPNIAAIYGIEERAIVMELVEGRDLPTPLPLDEALAVARQIADALEAAHERGIVHRDLKPANIKLTPDGSVKLLDFGLAKATDRSAANSTISPTLTIGVTQAGMIMGTAAYMAPEQAAGKPVDRRADIWSFGVVLYEMLTGARLFEGETVAHTLADVLRAEIDLARLPATTPPAVRDLLARCFDRNPRTRLRDIGEARVILSRPIQAAEKAQPSSTRARAPLWWVALAALALAGGAGWWRATRPAPLRPLVRLNAELAPDTTIAAGLSGGLLALSPDGTRLAVTLRGPDGKLNLYTRLLGQPKPVLLPGTEDAGTPFFSPDGKWIGFSQGGKLKKMAVDGGAPVYLCDSSNLRGASWGDDGNIVYGERLSSLWRISSDGGTPQALSKLAPKERNHRWPQVLPGSQAVLYTASDSNNYDVATVEVIRIQNGQRKVLVRGGHSGRYVATPSGSGKLLYVHENTLFAIPFDIKRLEVSGTPAPVLENVSSTLNGGADLALAGGVLVYLDGETRSAMRGSVIDSLDASGKRQPLHEQNGVYTTPRFSPDGKRLAFVVTTQDKNDIWIKDLDRGATSRLTFTVGAMNPIWTPDGKGIFYADRGLNWIRADGGGKPLRLTDGQFNEFPGSVSPDGKRIAFAQNGANGPDLYTAKIEGDAMQPTLGAREPFVVTPFVEWTPRFSPDGRWIAYVSNESGRFEVYVRPFPGPGGKWQISNEGGETPAWSASGRELLYKLPEGQIMAVSYTAKGDSFIANKPRTWTPRHVLTSARGFPLWDLTPDGKRIAAILRVSSRDDDAGETKGPTHLNFLINFTDELERRRAEIMP